MAKTQNPKRKSFNRIVGKKGALHRQLGVPEDQPIPPGKKAEALAGKYGPTAKARAINAFRGALAKGRKTKAKNQARKKQATSSEMPQDNSGHIMKHEKMKSALDYLEQAHKKHGK